MEGLKNTVVLELAQKIIPKFDEEYNQRRTNRTGNVEIRMKNMEGFT